MIVSNEAIGKIRPKLNYYGVEQSGVESRSWDKKSGVPDLNQPAKAVFGSVPCMDVIRCSRSGEIRNRMASP